jgi:hypothetical protein
MPETSFHLAAGAPVLPPLSAGDLTLYELQQPFVEPLLRMFRFTNTALDVLFYDVEVLRSSLLAKGTRIGTIAAARSRSAPHPLETLDLTAVCTENLIRIDCVTESPKRQRR